ncbi:MAG: ATP-binding protein [Candidatus Bathyarchaeota archaeon]|nr:ATP-binding protein [Candidatus Bathyarchaeota archaeon]
MIFSFSNILLVAASITFIAAVNVWARLRMPGRIPGSILITLGSMWSLLHWLQVTSVGSSDVLFWFRLQTICSYLVPPVFIIFSIRYFEMKQSTRENFALIMMIPLMFTVLTVTNDYHHLMWTTPMIHQNKMVAVNYGYAGFLSIFYVFAQVMYATYSYVRMITASHKLYKVRAVIFLVAISVYVTVYVLSSLGLLPNFLNISSLVFNFLSVSIAFIGPDYLYRLDVLPVAYESVIDKMKDAVIITDQNHRVIFMNDSARKLTETDEYKFLSLSIQDIVPDLFLDDNEEITEKTDIEYNERVYDLRVTSITDWQQDERTKIFIIRDITDLVSYSKGLEKVIDKKEEELRDAERMVAIGETTMMVGHDLRNPLQVIKGISFSMKKQHQENMKALNVFNMIDKSIFYMDKIVSDLQAFGKNRAPDARLYRMKDLMDNALSQLEIPDNVELILKFEDDFMVNVDWYFIQRVFINLMLNAVQAMPDGGTLRIQAFPRNKAHVIMVSDTGVGIAEENLDKLFKPLFTTKAKGTGLGLAVCKKIIESHKGTIEVGSNQGEGTIFTITLPSTDDAVTKDTISLDLVKEATA